MKTCEDCGSVDDCEIQEWFDSCHSLIAEKLGDVDFEFKLTLSDAGDCADFTPVSPCCGEKLDEDVMLCPACKEHC